MYENHTSRSFVFCCLLLLFAQPARAQLKGKIVYPRFSAYHPGDDTTWTQPEFDDSEWEKLLFLGSVIRALGTKSWVKSLLWFSGGLLNSLTVLVTLGKKF